jgi:hypothetical protein
VVVVIYGRVPDSDSVKLRQASRKADFNCRDSLAQSQERDGIFRQSHVIDCCLQWKM